ncbi:unnamed protein product [Echinostoma caproni]|uniref:G_PROTEIN_RECEP_F1_2 domain-containing protein n=1 Tax=Echinostoma caproni TaxID=27848 RepID=A0A183AAC4_9TREM|nr:unnamed protein product [Echinostoma caproni]
MYVTSLKASNTGFDTFETSVANDCDLSLIHYSGIKNLLEKCTNVSQLLQKELIQVFQEEYAAARNEPELPLPLLIGILMAFTIMILFGTLGSALVILVIARKSAMRSRSNMFIMNLAISDLTLCLFTEPFNLFQIWATHKPWILGSLMCKLLAMFQGTNIFVSTISITAIALDRFQCIIYPTMTNRRPHHVVRLLVLVWIVAFVLASPLAFFSHVDEVKVQRCTERTFDRLTQKLKVSYYVAALFFQYVVPLLIVSIVYWRIGLRIRNRHSRVTTKSHFLQLYADKELVPVSTQRVNNLNIGNDRPTTGRLKLPKQTVTDGPNAPSSWVDRLSKGQSPDKPHLLTRCSRLQRENRPILLLTAIAVVFGTSWLPLNIFNVYMEFREMMVAKHFQLPGMISLQNFSSDTYNQTELIKSQTLLGPGTVLIFQTFCLFLVLSSACFNPVLYGWLNENFRAEFRNVFRTRVRSGCLVRSCAHTGHLESGQFPDAQNAPADLNKYVIQWVLSPPYYSSCRIDSSISSDEVVQNNANNGIHLYSRPTNSFNPVDESEFVVSTKAGALDCAVMRKKYNHSSLDNSRPTNSSSSFAMDISDRIFFVDSESDRLEIERVNESLLQALAQNNDGQDTIPEVDPRPEQQQQQSWCSVITAV